MTARLRYRSCPHINGMCNCTDAEAVPCLAALVRNYLEELRMSVLGSRCATALAYRRAEVTTIGRSFETKDELLAWYLRVNGGDFE